MPKATREAIIRNKLGLHIRPSRQLATLVRKYDAEVIIRNQERTASAESQLDLLMLLATVGSAVTIEADGPDAEEAAAQLAALIESGFGEEI
ncbi:MAG: HPr family phosphocarrier protein [Pseudomonadota bacterium]